MEKKISKNQKMYPHRFGCSQNHQKAPQWGFLASLFSVPGWVGEFLLLVLGFGGPTKGIMMIWVHFVILVGCELVTFKPQIMLIFILVDKKICIACTVLHYQGHLAIIPRCRHWKEVGKYVLGSSELLPSKRCHQTYIYIPKVKSTRRRRYLGGDPHL